VIEPASLAILAVAGLATAGVILRPFRWPEAIWAVSGAAALLLAGLVSPAEALAAVSRGTEVYLFLIGMMALAELARREGLFDWTAAYAARLSRGSARRLFDLVYLVGVVVTALLSNDATAVVLTPAVYAAARAAKAEPLPYLFICAFVANAASFILPISNPANLVLFGERIPALGRWVAWFGPAALIAVSMTWLMLRIAFRQELRAKISADVPLPLLTLPARLAGYAIAAACLILLATSALDGPLGVVTFGVGLLAAAVVLLAGRTSPAPLLKSISWSVVPLVAGLFVLVAGLERSGLVGALAREISEAAAISPKGAGFSAGAILAVASNLMNNLPAGLLAASAAPASVVPPAVTGALLVGVDLGPNMSVTGSLATILWLIAIRREGEDVGAWRFLKLGLFVTLPALIPALAVVALLAPD
jgi:arsenical pump membrane protein